MEWYFSFNPLLRGVTWAFGTWLIMETTKPSFAFVDYDGEYIPRPFGGKKMTETEDGEVIAGTWLTWWSLPLLMFVIFGLFV